MAETNMTQGTTLEQKKGRMPRVPLHALIWSSEHSLYELYTQGQLEQRFQLADEAAWLAWLRGVSSFAFHSPGGSLNVYLEKRPRGGAYWYASIPARTAPASAISDGRRLSR